MLSNLYPALLYRLETTQDAILDAMDRLEIWLDTVAFAQPTPTTAASSGRAPGSSRATGGNACNSGGKGGDSAAVVALRAVWSRSSSTPTQSKPKPKPERRGSEVFDSSDDSDDER